MLTFSLENLCICSEMAWIPYLNVLNIKFHVTSLYSFTFINRFHWVLCFSYLCLEVNRTDASAFFKLLKNFKKWYLGLKLQYMIACHSFKCTENPEPSFYPGKPIREGKEREVPVLCKEHSLKEPNFRPNHSPGKLLIRLVSGKLLKKKILCVYLESSQSFVSWL